MKFGAELEFTAAVAGAGGGNKGTFYDYLQFLAAECGIINWKIEQDGSCGNEIVSPILDDEAGLRELLQMCHCAHKAGGELGIKRLTGVDCGIHFHFDARNLNHRQIRNSLIVTALAETLFYAMNPLSRFQTNFAAPLNFNLFQCIRARDLVDLRDLWFRSYMGVDANQDSYRHKHHEYYPAFINSEKKPRKYDWTRYHGFNFVSLFKHGTIEFRYAHGSFDVETVEMWYRLFRGVMDISVNNRTKDILKSNFPFTMNKIKLRELPQLQKHLFSDIRLILMFLFYPKNGTSKSLMEPTVRMMKFIGNRLVKFTHNAMSAPNYKALMKMGEDDSPQDALELLLDIPIRVPHGQYVNNHPNDMQH